MNNKRVVGLLFLLLSAAYIYYTGDITLDFWSEEELFNARTLPYAIGYCGVFFSVLLIVLPSEEFDWQQFRGLNYLPAFALLVCISAYGYLIEKLGFIVCSSLFLFVGNYLLGERKWLRMLITSLGMSLGFWLLMDQLGIYLARGDFWIGLANA